MQKPVLYCQKGRQCKYQKKGTTMWNINCLANFQSMILIDRSLPVSRTFDPRKYKNSTFKTVLISVPDAILGGILILLGTLFNLFPSVKNLIVSFLYMLHTVKWNLTWMQAMKCRLLRYCYSTCFSLKINFMVTENKKIGRFARMFCLCNYYRTIIWIEIWNELWNN